MKADEIARYIAEGERFNKANEVKRRNKISLEKDKAIQALNVWDIGILKVPLWNSFEGKTDIIGWIIDNTDYCIDGVEIDRGALADSVNKYNEKLLDIDRKTFEQAEIPVDDLTLHSQPPEVIDTGKDNLKPNNHILIDLIIFLRGEILQGNMNGDSDSDAHKRILIAFLSASVLLCLLPNSVTALIDDNMTLRELRMLRFSYLKEAVSEAEGILSEYNVSDKEVIDCVFEEMKRINRIDI